MNLPFFRFALTLVAILVGQTCLKAHGDKGDPNVTLHVSDRYSNCFIDLHSELTQSQFNRFSREASDVIYFRSMMGKPLNKGAFEFGIGMFKTPIDQTTPAWNNTFSHPEKEHWLGSEISIPHLSLKYGLSKKLQLGAYFTKDPNANYGFLGLDALFTPEISNAHNIRSSFRVNYTSMLFVEDMNLHTAGIGYQVSKTFFTCLTPYAGVAANGNLGIETTDEVDLKNSFSVAPRAIAGISYDKKFFHAALQADMSKMFSYSFQIGFRFLGEK